MMKSSDLPIPQKWLETALPSDVRKVFDLPVELEINSGLCLGSGRKAAGQLWTS